MAIGLRTMTRISSFGSTTSRTRKDKLIAQSMNGDFADLSWSGDSRWLAYSESADNQFNQIKILNIGSGAIQIITSDRYNSVNPIWSSDGKWLYFLSDRNLKSTIGCPWGPRQPEPHFDHSVKLYELALTPGLRSPFLPAGRASSGIGGKEGGREGRR